MLDVNWTRYIEWYSEYFQSYSYARLRSTLMNYLGGYHSTVYIRSDLISKMAELSDVTVDLTKKRNIIQVTIIGYSRPLLLKTPIQLGDLYYSVSELSSDRYLQYVSQDSCSAKCKPIGWPRAHLRG